MGFSWGVSFSNFIKWNWTSFDIINEAWHTPDLVCDDEFGGLEANSACYTLGYGGGTFNTSYYINEWSETEIPFLMDNVECGSASTNFLSCSSIPEDCSHGENVLLTCVSSGKTSCKFYFMLRLTKLVSRANSQICPPSIVTRANRECLYFILLLLFD